MKKILDALDREKEAEYESEGGRYGTVMIFRMLLKDKEKSEHEEE